MEILKSKKVIFLFLIFLLLVDFFVIGKIDSIPRAHQGYGFSYSLGKDEQKMLRYQYGFERIKYNFQNFFLFWHQPPLGRKFSNLKEFLLLDVPPSSLIANISHFFVFVIFALLLLYLFHLPLWQVFLTGCFFNIFHEYISEGIYIDPSFNDLWTDTLGLLTGLLIFVFFFKKK